MKNEMQLAAVCSRHPAERAQGTCARCGDFVCLLCWANRTPGFCRDCEERLARIPWEVTEQPVMRRFVGTLFASLRPVAMVACLQTDRTWISAITFGLTLYAVFSPLHAFVDLVQRPEYWSPPAVAAVFASSLVNNIAFVWIDILLWSGLAFFGALIAGVRVPLGILFRACSYTIWPWFAGRILFEGVAVGYTAMPLMLYEAVVLTALSRHHGTTLFGRRPLEWGRALVAGVPLPAVALALRGWQLWGTA